MPAKLPIIVGSTAENLILLGQQIRSHRKSLRITAAAAAEAAGMSRVTLHRIEKGEPAVTIGAYASAMAVLGLTLAVAVSAESTTTAPESREGWIPARVRLGEYPQLKQLAWQVRGTDTISPGEAFDLYERNWRHLDQQALTAAERHLIEALRVAFGGGPLRV